MIYNAYDIYTEQISRDSVVRSALESRHGREIFSSRNRPTGCGAHSAS